MKSSLFKKVMYSIIFFIFLTGIYVFIWLMAIMLFEIEILESIFVVILSSFLGEKIAFFFIPFFLAFITVIWDPLKLIKYLSSSDSAEDHSEESDNKIENKDYKAIGVLLLILSILFLIWCVWLIIKGIFFE